jgi:hypothetical protein
MTILLGICLALGLLYFWLLGHWFARVVMFLALSVLCGLGGVFINMTFVSDRPSAPAQWTILGLGIVLAWFISSIPLWHARRHGRRGIGGTHV